MRVLFYTNELDNDPLFGGLQLRAAAHYRCELPARALREWGGHETYVVPQIVIETATGLIAGRTFQGEIIEPTEIVVFQRPFLDGHADEIRAARAAGQVVIGEVDDSFFGEIPFRDELWLRGDHEFDKRLVSLKANLAACSAITVSTPHIARQMRTWAPSVHLIRNAIDIEAWEPPEDVTGPPVIGWTGTVPERKPDVALLRGWFSDFLEKHDLRFVHIGDLPDQAGFAETAEVNPERVEKRNGLPFFMYVPSRPLSGVDIQIIPIAASGYNLGKSALKGLESSACGVPFVASPHPEYQRLGIGRLAGSDLANQGPKFWTAALEAMLDPEERLRMAGEARERVAAEDIRVRWPEWENVYSKVLDKCSR